MDVSEDRGTPKSSILIGFSIINHPFWATTIFGNTHMGIFLSKVWHGILMDFLQKRSWGLGDIFLEQNHGNRRWNTIISNANNAFGEGVPRSICHEHLKISWQLAKRDDYMLNCHSFTLFFFKNQFFNKNPLKIHAPWGMEMCQKASACWKRRHRHLPSDVFCQLHPKWVWRFTVQRPTWGWLFSLFPENNTGGDVPYQLLQLKGWFTPLKLNRGTPNISHLFDIRMFQKKTSFCWYRFFKKMRGVLYTYKICSSQMLFSWRFFSRQENNQEAYRFGWLGLQSEGPSKCSGPMTVYPSLKLLLMVYPWKKWSANFETFHEMTIGKFFSLKNGCLESITFRFLGRK